MTMEDLQKSAVDEAELCLFPDALTMNSGRFRLDYEFNPGSQRDGVTLNVPASSASLVSRNRVDTLVPGLFEEKIAALIKALPKKFRVKLVPVSDKARIIAQEMPRQDKPLFNLLSAFVQQKFNLSIPPTLWSDKALPDHLKMRISIRDEQDREIKAIRDKQVLNEFPATRVPQTADAFSLAQKKYEITDIQEWNFKDLEPWIIVSQEKEFTQKAYPGLKIEPGPKSPKSDPVLSLRLFTSDATARESHCQGVRQLFLKCFPDQFKALKKDIRASAGIRQMAPFFNG
jgi:ATP-dependent helicase HrpA